DVTIVQGNISVWGSSNVTFSNIGFDGLDGHTTLGVSNGNNININNCKFSNYADAALGFGDSNNVSVTNSSFFNNRYDIIFSRASGNVNGNTFEAAQGSPNNEYCIDAMDDSKVKF